MEKGVNMSFSGKICLKVAVAVLVLGLVASPVTAMQIPLELSDLVAMAEVIVLGKVLAVTPFVMEEHQVMTRAEVKVEEELLSLINVHVDSYIDIIYPGGYIPDYKYSVELTDVPHLDVGVEYFLFLTHDSGDDYRLVSPQGAIRLQGEVVGYDNMLAEDFRNLLYFYVQGYSLD